MYMLVLVHSHYIQMPFCSTKADCNGSGTSCCGTLKYCKFTCHIKTQAFYLTLTSHSLVHFPVGCSGRCFNWVLSGHQLGNGAPCYSSANDEHLFAVPMPSFTDALESCNLEAASSGNNTPAVGSLFFFIFFPVFMCHFRL